MNKQRLETFSDGVFAIVITLLILSIRIPEVPPTLLGTAMVQALPEALTYLLSFFVVGFYWLVHHRVSSRVRQVDGPLFWINLLWLLFVSIIPFPTALLGRYPLQIIPIALYGFDLILANITGFFLTIYLMAHPHLCSIPAGTLRVRGILPAYGITNGAYLLAIALAWIAPWCSYLIFAGVLIWLALRYSRRQNPFGRTAGEPAVDDLHQ